MHHKGIVELKGLQYRLVSFNSSQDRFFTYVVPFKVIPRILSLSTVVSKRVNIVYYDNIRVGSLCYKIQFFPKREVSVMSYRGLGETPMSIQEIVDRTIKL